MTVELREIARYLRMGRNVPDGALAERIVALRDEALPVCRPAKVWRRFAIGCGETSRRADPPECWLAGDDSPHPKLWNLFRNQP